jgi:hypothetical protein
MAYIYILTKTDVAFSTNSNRVMDSDSLSMVANNGLTRAKVSEVLVATERLTLLSTWMD